MPVAVGRDVLFFDKVDCSQQSLTATLTRGAALLTPNLIAMIPAQSFGSIFVASVVTRYGSEPLGAARALLADPTMTVATLEGALAELYAAASTRWLFPIRDLETFKVTTGFFGMISLKLPGESVRRMVIRDKGGKAAAQAYYADALAARR